MILNREFFDTYTGISIKMAGVYLAAVALLFVICTIMNAIYPLKEVTFFV